MDSDYVLLLKTAQSELRAWKHLPQSVKDHILPILELTRGRKVLKKDGAAHKDLRKIEGAYNFGRNVDNSLKLVEAQSSIILDLTREDSLSCYEIDALSNPQDGYAAWREFLSKSSRPGINIIPTVAINPEPNTTPKQYISDINDQVIDLFARYSGVCYRTSVLEDSEFLYDIAVLKSLINDNIDNGKKFIVVLDHEFIRPKTGTIHAVRTSGIVDRVFEMIPGANVVVMATSFPKSIEDIGNADQDTFPIEERYLFDQVKRNTGSRNYKLTYGDYGSINPERNDMIVTGWRPRIDFPTAERRTYYYREKRDVVGRDTSTNKPIYEDYSKHYKSVAQKVVRDPRFVALPTSWGCDQIQSAAFREVPGSNPSFWISVRMEIHIQQMVRTIGSAGSDAIST